MMKKLAAIALCAIIMLTANIFVFAAEISDVKTDMPSIDIKVSAPAGAYDNIDAGKVKATLDGQELKVSSAEVKGGTNEWIVLIDTSKSTKSYFEAEKNAVLSVYKSLGKNDKLSLYTFDTGIKKVLDGTEKPEDAEKKIKALTCEGQDTVFYESVDKLLEEAKKSKNDNVIPVIFSDGVDTLSKSTNKKAITEKLAKEKIPVFGLYNDSLKAETANAFKDLLKKSGGNAEAFGTKNATEMLSKKNAANEIIISAVAASDIKANDNAVLSVDLGDGKAITQKTKVEAWSNDTTAPEILSAEADTAANTVTVKFSEDVLNADKNESYIFTCSDESKVEITGIEYGDSTAVISVDSLDKSGVSLKVSGITDKALNAAAEKEFVITEVKSNFPLIPVIIVAILLIVLVAVLLIGKLRKKDNADVSGASAEDKKAKKKKDKEAEQFKFYFVDKK